ncbi:MAG TPA: hypothetical protein VNT50_12520, partial [Microbacterium sp.]|nr:hypothetical protein [Microbacterium sp.]
MADESNDTLDHHETAPEAPEVAAIEPTWEPLEGPDVELPMGASTVDAVDAVEESEAVPAVLPEALEGPDVELPTGDEASDEQAAEHAPEPEQPAEPEPAG